MYFVAALELPFNDKSLEGIMNKILYKQPPTFTVAYSGNLKEFIFAMLEKDKSKRPFVIDLFKLFPSKLFKIESPEDLANFEEYHKFTDSLN